MYSCIESKYGIYSEGLATEMYVVENRVITRPVQRRFNREYYEDFWCK